MFGRFYRAPVWFVVVACCAACVLAGCGPVDLNNEQVLGYHPSPPNTPSGDPIAGASDSSANAAETASNETAATAMYNEVEPNDSWDDANWVDLQSDAVETGSVSVELDGSIGAMRQDFDVFALGAAVLGRRVQADLAANGDALQLGLFDDQGHVLAYIDPRSATAGPGRIDIVLHESTSQLYAIVGTRSASTEDRPYSVHVEIGQAESAPPVATQNVVFVLSGATQVRIGSRSPVDVPPFDIARINSAFAGRTEGAIELLMQIVREDYDGLNVVFYRDDDPDAPADDCTKIYFGSTDTALLGLADNIDPYNADATQSAIIYTDTFSLFNQLNPSLENIVQVLANVASHETGHLLGLRHTADIQDLMDVTASARQMMADQWFKTATLDDSVMPYGVQDAPTMLSWALGDHKSSTTTKLLSRRVVAAPPTGGTDFYIPRSMLADCGCPTCTADLQHK